LCFLQHPGELLDKATLMAEIWPNAVVEENNLNQQICALRRALGERPGEHRYLVTIPGRGYRLMTYRAAPAKSLATIAHELAASHLIEGSVRREGDKARLTLQLIDARTDKEIWSTSCDRTLADTLTLESQVAQEIAAQLALRLEPPATLPPAKSLTISLLRSFPHQERGRATGI
jgi:hypothetical protein